jgi:hypothetical protein
MYECYHCSRRPDTYGFWNFVWDMFMLCITLGLWIVYMIIREIRRSRRSYC